MTIEQAEIAYKIRKAYTDTKGELLGFVKSLDEAKNTFTSKESHEVIDNMKDILEKALNRNEQDYKNNLAEIN